MAFAIAWIVRKAASAKTNLDSIYSIFLLVMMASMFGGFAIYLLNPTSLGIVMAVGVNMAVMTGGVLVVLRYWLEKASVDRNHGIGSGKESGKRSLENAVQITRTYVIFLFTMFASMVTTALLYEVNPSLSGSEISLGSGMAIMVLGTLLILRISSKHNRSARNANVIFRFQRTSLKKICMLALILLNEYLMGWVFVTVSGTTIFEPTTDLASFSNVVSSYWFILIMTLEMVFTIFMFKHEIPRSFLLVLLLQAGIMLFSPPAIIDPRWRIASIYLGSCLMTVLFVFFYEHLFKNKLIEKAISSYFLSLLAIYSLMMAGLFIWIANGNTILFAISIVLEMILYFNLVIYPRELLNRQQLKSWLSNPLWVFAFLVVTFVAEFFMGGLLDVAYYGQGFLEGIALAPLTGSLGSRIVASLYDFLSYFSAVTGSAWYLIMMGAEMGALVIFKMKQVREIETRIRLGLVVVSYAVYAVYLPNFFFPSANVVAKIPFVGWSMGIGTSAGFAPVFVTSIGLTYLISGTLAFLFGGRQVCSLFCTASLMYQGTFPDSLKTFNRTSKLGRKLLTSRMSSIYKVVSSLVIFSLIVASALSYLNSVHIIDFTVYGADATTLLYNFYFNFLWYMIFLAMPFIGTYGCVSTGMCHWGLFNQFMGRLGFFRLKVKNPEICVSCPTKDCAKACPVGLTDLPSKFISNGEFRSHKCIGVGDCVSSCPYENEYFYDVRHWMKDKFRGEKKRHQPSFSSLPVLRDVWRAPPT